MDNNTMIVCIIFAITIMILYIINAIVALCAIYKNARYKNSINWNSPILNDLVCINFNTEVN